MTHTALPLHCVNYPALLPPSFCEASYNEVNAKSPQRVRLAPRSNRKATRTSIQTLAKPRGRGRPPLVRTNTLKNYLEAYSSPGHALAKLPHLSDIVTGAVNLDYCKNTRPLSIKTVIVLLRRLDMISTQLILDDMQLSLRHCSERHAQRLAMCLRIIERAAQTVKCKWPEPSHIDEADSYTAMRTIVPCSEQGCLICRSSANVEQAWSLSEIIEDHQQMSFELDGVEVSAEDDWADLENNDLFACD